MARMIICASGNGSNFEAITKSFMNDPENKIVLLICNNEKAFAIDRAKKYGIPYKLVKYQKGEGRESVEAEILKAIKENKTDVVFLAGYMKIFTTYFFKNIFIPVVNIHPSILPKYKGVNAIEQAFQSNDKEIGITIHYVVEEVDAGEIILQKIIPLNKKKGLDFIEKEIHKLEHKWYPIAAKEICDKINKQQNK